MVAHLNPNFIPKFHLLVLDIPVDERSVSPNDLPTGWQNEQPEGPLQLYLTDWLTQPDCLTVSVPSAIVTRSRNYLIHTLHPRFTDEVKIIENEPFQIDTRVVNVSL